MSRIERIEQLLSNEPDDVFLNFSLAMEYVKAERADDALARFARVHKLDPDYVPAYYQRGNLLASLDRIDPACEALREGIAAAKRNGDQHAVDEMQQSLDLLSK